MCLYVAYNCRSSNIGEFSRDMQMLAALQEEENDGDRLMDAARKLAGAFSDLLTAAQPGTNQVLYMWVVGTCVCVCRCMGICV